MTLPLAADVSGNIKNPGELGNDIDGDCTVAAYLHLLMCLARVRSGPLKTWAYKLGFKVPGQKFAIAIYAKYLATLNEKPGPASAVYVDAWLKYLQGQGEVLGYAQIPPTSVPCATQAEFDAAYGDGSAFEAVVRAAMINFGGVLIAGNLSVNAMDIFMNPQLHAGDVWSYSAAPHDQPSPDFGHAMALVKFNPKTDTVVTWGKYQAMTTEFRAKCLLTAFVFVHKSDPNAAEKLTLLNTLWTPSN